MRHSAAPLKLWVGHHDGVAWEPDWSQQVDDPRLDPYRHRAAKLLRDGLEVGSLYAEPSHVATQERGHLWWRSYSQPREMLQLWLQIDGRDDDYWSDGEDLTADLEGWRAGVFVVGGQEYGCKWLGDEESEAIGRQLGIRDPADEVADGQPENYRPRRRKTVWARVRDGL